LDWASFWGWGEGGERDRQIGDYALPGKGAAASDAMIRRGRLGLIGGTGNIRKGKERRFAYVTRGGYRIYVEKGSCPVSGISRSISGAGPTSGGKEDALAFAGEKRTTVGRGKKKRSYSTRWGGPGRH